MKTFTILLICSIFQVFDSAYVILPENFTAFIRNASEEVKNYFFDNKLIAVDYLDSQNISPPSNCLNASIDNPSLLIYCLVIALVWLATVATGLFFYFRAIFHKLSAQYYPEQSVELQPIIKNGRETNRTLIMGE